MRAHRLENPLSFNSSLPVAASKLHWTSWRALNEGLDVWQEIHIATNTDAKSSHKIVVCASARSEIGLMNI